MKKPLVELSDLARAGKPCPSIRPSGDVGTPRSGPRCGGIPVLTAIDIFGGGSSIILQCLTCNKQRQAPSEERKQFEAQQRAHVN